LLVSYAAGSPDCRLAVAVYVLVVVKHMAMAALLQRTCMMGATIARKQGGVNEEVG